MSVARKILFFLTPLGLLAPACRAPAAEPIEGDIATAIAQGIASGEGSFDHGDWDQILKAHAKREGRRFDYRGLARDASAFDEYLERLAGADLSTLSRAELMALLINAYNAFTVDTIVDTMEENGDYGVESIRDIPDVFDREVHELAGYRLSLNNIEHNILRPLFKDPRVHFAVNCASISCPPLPPEAFTGNRLDTQLEHYTRKTLSNSDYVAVEGKTLRLTKILEWYGEDFINPEFSGSKSSVDEFVADYATDEVRSAIENQSLSVGFNDYDWNLNKPE